MGLDGYKTYITALGMVGYSLYLFSTERYVEGFQMLFGSGVAAALRRAVTKAVEDIKRAKGSQSLS